ncbi:Fe(2+) transporter [Apophysomyces sp. BC1034]|nr:Fe(2+) transporter [Apophysomyces sp. BC1034]
MDSDYEYEYESLGANSTMVQNAIAGALAGIGEHCIMYPIDSIKRMQLRDSTYRSVRECARKVYAAEGFKAFYISLPTTLYMSIPFQSIQFTTYEFFRSFLNPGGAYDPKSHVVAGALAGMVASSVTIPLDVIKTLLQTRGSSTDPRIRNASGFWDAAKIIGERYGYQGFFRGFKPRILTHMPSTAVSWTVYEYFKWFLSNDDGKMVHRV